MAMTLDYAEKLYSYVPAREKKFLKDQVPRATKLGNKLVNLLQREISDAKSTAETATFSRIVKMKRAVLKGVLVATEKAISAVQAFADMDAPVVLQPVDLPHYEVIPESMQSVDLPRPPKKKRAAAKKVAAARSMSRESSIGKVGMKKAMSHQSATRQRAQAARNARRHP